MHVMLLGSINTTSDCISSMINLLGGTSALLSVDNNKKIIIDLSCLTGMNTGHFNSYIDLVSCILNDAKIDPVKTFDGDITYLELYI